MKDNITQNGQGCKPKEEFTGKNLTRFGGAWLVRRFFDKLHIVDHLAGLGTSKRQEEAGPESLRETVREMMLRLTDTDICLCPHCGKGRMIRGGVKLVILNLMSEGRKGEYRPKTTISQE